jgi:hypothetical protein
MRLTARRDGVTPWPAFLRKPRDMDASFPSGVQENFQRAWKEFTASGRLAAIS